MINIVAEIGINHNGSLPIVKKLIDVAAIAGCDYVKFQKRSPDLCVPKKQQDLLRQTPWGEMKYINYKKKIEFGNAGFVAIDKHCKSKNIKWFSSVWDLPSVDFCSEYKE